jgi:hypothetical protein
LRLDRNQTSFANDLLVRARGVLRRVDTTIIELASADNQGSLPCRATALYVPVGIGALRTDLSRPARRGVRYAETCDARSSR